MTGMRIVMDDGEARLLLDSSIANARNLTPVMAEIAGELDDRVQQAFTNHQDPVTGAPWPELTIGTVVERERKGYGGADILERTRILRNSVIPDYDRASAHVYTSGVEYALTHFFGSDPIRNIPQRRFAGASPDDIDSFRDLISAHILRG